MIDDKCPIGRGGIDETVLAASPTMRQQYTCAHVTSCQHLLRSRSLHTPSLFRIRPLYHESNVGSSGTMEHLLFEKESDVMSLFVIYNTVDYLMHAESCDGVQ